MNKSDLQTIGDVYGQILEGVEVVEEEKELNDKGAAGLLPGGPQEKGGFSKKRLDGADDEYQSKKFTQSAEEDEEDEMEDGEEDAECASKKFKVAPGEEDECDEEDEELMVEAVNGIGRVFGESAEPNDDVIEMVVEMGKLSLSNLRNVIHNLNRTNKQATINLLTVVNENSSNPLYDECGQILDAVIRYDKKVKRRTTLTESTRKGRKRAINNSSMKKSSFDKLFEAVMDGGYDDELDELGVDDTNDEFGDLGGELEDDVEGGDEVTFTLDRMTAQSLCDALQASLGEGDELEDVDDLEGEDDFGDEGLDDDFGGDLEEDEELPGTAGGSAKGEGIPAEAGVPKQHGKAVDYGKKNKVSKLKPRGAASAKGEGIPAEAGVPKQRGQAVDMGKQNKRGKLTPGTSMFD
jgi:hypothetical protein